jgi:hypothetical protein
MLLFLAACVGGQFLLAFDRQRGRTEPETIVAEIVDLRGWVNVGKWGDTERYSVSLKENGTEFSCRVESQEMVQHWQDLKIGRMYEFTITRKGGNCFIQSATEAENQQFLGEGD